MAWIKAEMERGLHRELKSKAAKLGVTVEQAIIQAVDRWIYGGSNSPITTGAKK